MDLATTEIPPENGIAQLKARFPLPLFLISRGLGEHAHKSAQCPLHDDQRNSFSIFLGRDGDWHWKCHAGCGGGDAIDLICRLDGVRFKTGLARYRKESRSNHVLGLIEKNIDYRRHVGDDIPLKRQQDGQPTEFNWSECAQRLARDGDLINSLAKRRGYNPATIWTLLQHDLIGQFQGHFAFPVVNLQRVIGCHYLLLEEHEWRYTPGCSAIPLLFGVGPEYHATESTWDGIALIDQLGFEDVTVVVTRGAGNAATIADCVPSNIIVRLWPQNDQAGQQWAEDAVRALSRASICKTPPEFKDPNEWFLNT
jgi:hypothetical protein